MEPTARKVWIGSQSMASFSELLFVERSYINICINKIVCKDTFITFQLQIYCINKIVRKDTFMHFPLSSGNLHARMSHLHTVQASFEPLYSLIFARRDSHKRVQLICAYMQMWFLEACGSMKNRFGETGCPSGENGGLGMGRPRFKLHSAMKLTWNSRPLCCQPLRVVGRIKCRRNQACFPEFLGRTVRAHLYTCAALVLHSCVAPALLRMCHQACPCQGIGRCTSTSSSGATWALLHRSCTSRVPAHLVGAESRQRRAVGITGQQRGWQQTTAIA